jgi:hypothetical protein
MRRRAYRPPFRVGDNVRYEGTSTAWFSTSGEVDVDTNREPDLYPGVVGTVIENRSGIDAHPELFGLDDQPCDGWSVIQLPSGATRAAQRPEPDWYVVGHRDQVVEKEAER